MASDLELIHLPRPKVLAIKHVRQMFRDRKYNQAKETLVFDQHHNMWELFTETAAGAKVMAVFAECDAMGDVMEIAEFTPEGRREDEADMQSGEKCKVTANVQNTGMDFVKNLVRFALDKQLKVVLLISDRATTHALKHISSVKGVDFSHFSYEEVGIENKATHIMQPVVFRALEGKERAEFIRANPRYKLELQRYSVHDALVKHYGMHIGDIVYIEDNDRQTGLVVEYALIAEEL